MFNKIIDYLPDGVFCREIKLLYKSGRLVDGFYGKDLDFMALTRFEKMFVSWAIRKWREENRREELKQWATKLAITGKDDHAESKVAIPFTHNTIPFTGKQMQPPPSIRLSLAEMELAMEDARREAESSGLLPKSKRNYE
jgi:hypothetical protein